MSLVEDRQVPGLVVEVLHVEHCPNFPAALALVQRVIAELGVDAEVRTSAPTGPGRECWSVASRVRRGCQMGD